MFERKLDFETLAAFKFPDGAVPHMTPEKTFWVSLLELKSFEWQQFWLTLNDL